MPGSSADQPIFEIVRPRDVYRLLEIVHTATVRDASFVESRFAETAAHFDETLGFLRELGWVRSAQRRLPESDRASVVSIIHVVHSP